MHLPSLSLLQTLSPRGNIAEAKSSPQPNASESRMQNTLPHLENRIPSSQSTFHISGTSQGISHLCHYYKHFYWPKPDRHRRIRAFHESPRLSPLSMIHRSRLQRLK